MTQTMQMLLVMEGTERKLAGQKKALEHTEAVSPNWTERTLEALSRYCSGLKSRGETTLVMEDFKATRFHDLPVSHNAWGSIPGIACKRGILRATGEFRKARSEKAHERIVRVWGVV